MKNFLSYGPDEVEIKLHRLNILVGANGSGKSNLFEAVSLLRSTPNAVVAPVRKGGGVADWLWKGAKDTPAASIAFDFENHFSAKYKNYDITYAMEFTVVNSRFEIISEKIVNAEPLPGQRDTYKYYEHNSRSTMINVAGQNRRLMRETIDPEASIFSQRKDPLMYTEITHLSKQIEAIKIYREWHFGIDSAVRQSQSTDEYSGALCEDCHNLALVFNSLLNDMSTQDAIQEEVKKLYDGIKGIGVQIIPGQAVLQIYEQGLQKGIPANRLSDGTLRYLCLVAILMNPNPPPLICLDEPELGMHPDLIRSLASMLLKASERTQIIVNTHSPLLLDAFSEYPEYVLVCQKEDGCSVIDPIPESAKELLKSERLGDLWMRGAIGGTRW